MHRRTLTTAAVTAGLLALLAAPAAAHVTANPNSLEADGRGATELVVPHGCEGSPTEVVEVAIPDEIESVTPEQLGGWEAEITDDAVVWTADEGGALPDDQFRGFGLRLVLPDLPGEVLWFPTIQTCEDGSEEAWIEIPDDVDGWGDLDYPAPYVELTEAAEGSGHSHDDGAEDEAHEDEDGAAGDEAEANEEHDPDDASDEAASGEEDDPDLELAASEDGGTDALVYVALVVGVLGAALGAAGLAAARRTS